MSEDQRDHDEGFFWESQSWGFSNSDNNSGNSEGIVKSNMNPSKAPGLSSNNNQTLAVEAKAVAAPGQPSSAAPSKKRCRGGSAVPKNGEGKGGAGGEAGDHEIHIWTERERRKKMRNMFASLHALLPQLPPKADKSTVVDEAVNYIKSLQVTLQKLQKQKLERLHTATTFSYDPSLLTPIQKLPYNSREAFLADQGSSSNINHGGSLPPSGPSSSNSSPLPRYPVVFQTWTSSNVVLNICGDSVHFNICSSRRPGVLAAILCALEKYKIEVMSVHVSSDCHRSFYMIQAHVNMEAHDQLTEVLTIEDVCRQAAGEIMLWTSP
ncbi:transcription factor bHLH95 [Punica granatum]|uniref:BHLH domain-containing protein n=2 Tax=Punica granatum TaxID=22663 RepID=A0A218XFL2_PUNGR|nr:transcription factor bHLH95 [Punica granatum]OWM83714.1 hypothetical protein CDL15_Pgr004144 [Punica granatum]PKI75316.1 hypothetical protein CRG98_004356 [Punica granatum]